MKSIVYNISFNIVYFFTILYNTIIYNNFDSISQYPFMFMNYIIVLFSCITFLCYEKRLLSVIKFKRIYYGSIAYNVLVYMYLNLAIWTFPNYIYTFKVSQKDLFKDPSYLSYLIVLTALSISVISILKIEQNKYKETIRYINMV